jgi:hypothetical protein
MEIINRNKIVCLQGVWWNVSKIFFLKFERNLIGLDGDGSYNLKGILLGWIDYCQNPQEGLLMSYGKTLELGF